jgi:hypothetical protein
MDEQVRSELIDLLRTGGRNLCTMPRMLGTMLRQRCPDGEEPIRCLEDALANGCIAPILATVGAVDEPALVHDLVARTGMTTDRAQWVIASWVQALDVVDAPPTIARDWSQWNRLDVSEATQGGSGAYQRAVGHLIVVGLAGAAGGTTLGFFTLIRGDAALVGPWQAALEEVEPWMQVPALVVLGVLGGFTGGLLGWIIGGGRSWTYDAHGGTTLGRLVLSAVGAFHGSGIGVVLIVALLGLIGVMFGALVGGLVGAFLGLLLAEGISRFWR